MKILVVSNYVLDNQQSMQRFGSLLAQGLTERGHEVRVIRPEPILGRITFPSVRTRKWVGYGDKFLAFPIKLKRSLDWADIVHVCDHSNALYIPYIKHIPHVLTCHDLLAVRSALGEIPEQRTGWTGRVFQSLILNGIRQAKYIACVSEYSRMDLIRVAQYDQSRTSVVHNDLNYPYAPSPNSLNVLKSLDFPLNHPYILHVGGNQWYKNRRGVLSIFRKIINEAPDLNLVMVGAPFTSAMREFVTKENLSDRVFEFNNVSNEVLQALYTEAKVFLFPSLEEGFGWPVVEAQACDCPVVCSSDGSLTEVAGDGAFLAPASDEFALSKALLRLIYTSEERISLIGRGRSNANRFQSKNMIRNYENIYKKLSIYQKDCK